MAETRDDLLRAIDLALADRWDEAHDLAQRHEDDATGQWIHAVLHKIEGDASNARYWYQRAGRLDRVDAAPREELESIRATLAE
jgi:hypothetical protein